jgi:hypothetical protein
VKPLERTGITPESVAASKRDLMSRDNVWWEKNCGVQFLDDDSKEAYINQVIHRENREVWANEKYCVHVEDMGEMVHLSIKRHDRKPVTDWRDKQEIKNQLVGPEAEGLELYPAESRVVDTANQYHLWCFKTMKLEVGFQFGIKSDENIGFSQQRKRNG